MPIKLNKAKTEQVASARLPGKEYRVILFYKKIVLKDKDGNDYQPVKYYQVQKNRKKISNYQTQETAIKRMMTEANYELYKLF